jgi:ethanolamine utilization protein EutA
VNQIIKSVGIDIGTSTSKLMFSELTLGRVSNHFSLPHFEIVERKVTYVSEMVSTPLKNREEIELLQLVGWIEKEYQMAGIRPSEIKSGAVIITGETAIKKNADALIHYLAERAGDFVVAIAGASLEAVLAGRGSGAYELSLKSREVIANIDIGGGTSNVVFFRQGRVLETITFHVGGRLIEIDESGLVLSISPSLRPWLSSRNINIGARISFDEISKIAEALSSEMMDVLNQKKTVSSLIHSRSNQVLPRIEKVMISGGVGRLTEEQSPTTLAEAARFHDIGPILASKLTKVLLEYPYEVIRPLQTSSATVIGAGMQTTVLSGATISIKPDLLPIRNLPVVRINLTEETGFQTELEMAFSRGRDLFASPFALGLSNIKYLTYRKLKELAAVLGQQFIKYFPNNQVLVIVCESDCAKALGQVLRLQFDFEVICIDQVVIEQGDYIDIGEPLHEAIVPVVVKTLAFR